METLFFLILITLLVYPLSFVKPRMLLRKKSHLIAYICIVLIALIYLIMNHFISGTDNVYFILFLTLIASVNIFRLIKKRKISKWLKDIAKNKVYNKNKHLSDLEFLNGILDAFQIKFKIPKEDLKRLPKDGAYITISNHPLGGIDGILLLKLMLEQRSDFKIIANFLIHRIKPL